jgi:hypothetical protein
MLLHPFCRATQSPYPREETTQGLLVEAPTQEDDYIVRMTFRVSGRNPSTVPAAKRHTGKVILALQGRVNTFLVLDILTRLSICTNLPFFFFFFFRLPRHPAPGRCSGLALCSGPLFLYKRGTNVGSSGI